MNYISAICPFSGITYHVTTPFSKEELTSSDKPLISIYPALDTHLSQVLSYKSSVLKTFALLYSLRSFSLMEYTYCRAFSFPKDVSNDVLETLVHEINTRLQRCITKIINIPAKSRKSFPRIRLHKTTLMQIRNYCDALEVAISGDNAAEQFLATTTPGQRRAHIAQKVAMTSAINVHVKWAEETLITRTNFFNVTLSNNLRASIEGKANIAVMKRVRDVLIDHLPETKSEDVIRKDALIYAIDLRISEKVASFGEGGLLSPEEKEAARSVVSRYSVLDEVPASIQALDAMTSQKITSMPVREDYATSLEFTVAMLAYKAMNPST